jgi:hypothetical protein
MKNNVNIVVAPGLPTVDFDAINQALERDEALGKIIRDDVLGGILTRNGVTVRWAS